MNKNAILITLALSTIKKREGGYRQIVMEWLASDGEPTTWWYKCSKAPNVHDLQNLEWVYWVVMGRIRWRSRLLAVEKNNYQRFSQNGPPLFAKNWLVLFDFERLPRKSQTGMKGFQGFRYHFTDDCID